jgi:GH24 family phage-related lysozyme (muramidase)
MCNDLLRWEGSKPFMYVDTRGYVTTGIGNKLSNVQEATSLPWLHKATGLPATPPEIRIAFGQAQAKYAEFRREHPDLKKSAGADYYKDVSDLVLPAATTRDLAASRVEGFVKSLRSIFPRFDSFPTPAQRALVDMIYTLGAKGLTTKFPTVVKACKDGRFDVAAQFCHRKAHADEHRKDDARNVATRDLFKEAERLSTSLQSSNREVRL